MLHRMAMRVVPALTVAVTEEAFRKRKRIVMLFPGLVAFALYRGLQTMGWQGTIVPLLLAGGFFSALVALVAYAYGRERRVLELIREAPPRVLAWLTCRIGFLYAVQLSLMVLALLKVATYSYAEHPDGPAMMALIIASTSVARDAFEIGHLHFLQQQGRPFVTLPDGKAWWAFVIERTDLWSGNVVLATFAVGLGYIALAGAFPILATDLGQLVTIGMLVGVACTVMFVKGLHPAQQLWKVLTRYSWRELVRFFMWPGMAFGWTYFLCALGALNFLFAVPHPPAWMRGVVAAGIGASMSLYGYYLGRSRWQEEKLHATISPSLLRCPFIVGILTSKKA